MEDSLQLCVCEPQGIAGNLACLGCYCYVDDELRDVITPLNCADEVSLTGMTQDSVVRLHVKSMLGEDALLGSVSFLRSALPEAGHLTVPLFTDPNNDFLDSFPETLTGVPTITLLINQRISTVPDTDSSEEEEVGDADFEESVEDFELEKAKLMVQKYKALYEDQQHDLDTCKAMLEEAVAARMQSQQELQQMKCKHLSTLEAKHQQTMVIQEKLSERVAAAAQLELEVQGLRAQMSQLEGQLLHITHEADLLRHELKTSQDTGKTHTETLQQQLETVTAQKASLATTLAGLNDTWHLAANKEATDRLHSLEAENSRLRCAASRMEDILKNKHKVLEFNHELKNEQDSIYAELTGLVAENARLKQRVQMLVREKHTLRRTLLTEDNKSTSQPSDVEFLLRDYFKRNKQEVTVQRLQEKVFLLNEKRAVVDIKKGSLRCKHERKFYAIEEFAQLLTKTSKVPKVDENCEATPLAKHSVDLGTTSSKVFVPLREPPLRERGVNKLVGKKPPFK